MTECKATFNMAFRREQNYPKTAKSNLDTEHYINL